MENERRRGSIYHATLVSPKWCGCLRAGTACLALPGASRLSRSESCPTGQSSLQQSQPGACTSNLSKLNGLKLRLSPPHCDWSACLHQHFFCTCLFNPTRPFFMLSNRPPSGYGITPSQQLAAVSPPFSTPDLLGTTGRSLPLHNDIPSTTSQKLQPTLLIVTSRTLGPLALSVIVSHFL